MDLSEYLCQKEVTQLIQAFEISLQHDSTVVFWTGISRDRAEIWARGNNMKTLTMAMGSLYTDNSRKGLKSSRSTKSKSKSWSKYMKGASWLFAEQACHNRHAIVLTNAPPNVYSTRQNSSYREIEEPILKGLGGGQHTIQIDYVHPTLPGAARFRYQIWPENRSFEWFRFLECIAIKDIVKKIVQRPSLRQSENLEDFKNAAPPENGLEKSSSLATVLECTEQETAREKKVAKRLQAEREQQAVKQAAREKKGAKRLRAERQQQVATQAAREKKAAKRLQAEREQQAVKQAAREKKAAKRLQAEREQQVVKQAAREKKAAKQLKANALGAIGHLLE